MQDNKKADKVTKKNSVTFKLDKNRKKLGLLYDSLKPEEKQYTLTTSNTPEEPVMWVDMGGDKKPQREVSLKKQDNLECYCKDWKENIDKMNAGWALDFVHGGVGYTGKQIRFCPWCGKKLHKEKTSEKTGT